MNNPKVIDKAHTRTKVIGNYQKKKEEEEERKSMSMLSKTSESESFCKVMHIRTGISMNFIGKISLIDAHA